MVKYGVILIIAIYSLDLCNSLQSPSLFLPFLLGHFSRYLELQFLKIHKITSFIVGNSEMDWRLFLNEGSINIFVEILTSLTSFPISLALLVCPSTLPCSLFSSVFWYLCIFRHFLCWLNSYLYPGTFMTYNFILLIYLLKHDISHVTNPGQITQTLNGINVCLIFLAFLCFCFFWLFKLYACVCVPECTHVHHMCVGTYKAYKGWLDTQELKLQAFFICL